MAQNLYGQLVGLAAATLLLTAVLLVWRRSVAASVRLLSMQGAALAVLVAVIAVHEPSAQLAVVAGLVFVLKAVVLPRVLGRSVGLDPAQTQVPRVNPTAALISAALLTILAYLVSRPILEGSSDHATQAVPVAVALVLIGFLLLVVRRHALAQLVGFLVLDNGIATVAFLTSAGVPLVVELGVSLDVLLVVLVLHVLTGRMRTKFGATDLDDLTELRD